MSRSTTQRLSGCEKPQLGDAFETSAEEETTTSDCLVIRISSANQDKVAVLKHQLQELNEQVA